MFSWRWHPIAASNSKTSRSVFRCLRSVLFPHTVALVVLCVFYSVVEYSFTNWYFGVYGFVWKPAFPWSWRLLFLLLCAVPVFAFLHLLWLLALAHLWWRRKCNSLPKLSQGYVMLPRSESDPLGESEPSGARDDEDRDSRDIEGGADASRLHSSIQPPHRLISSDWFIQFISWLVLLCISLTITLRRQQPGDLRYLSQVEHANAHPNRAGYANQEKIFIAAMFYDNEQILPYWSNSLIKAIHYLGEDNVFVSILESGSNDKTPELLQQLDDSLDAMNVSRRILIHDTMTRSSHNISDHERVPFLATLRNRVLEPLVENGGYDKVVFSNDIYIEPETIIELLNTADGEYDMACGMDFGFFGLYDLWVLRDKRGSLAGSIWPYFFDMEDYEAMQTESPVPVFTCWNGIVVFNADPVLPIYLRSNRTLSTDPLPYELPATHPASYDPSLRGPSPALTPPARFRASTPGECFSSESFLLPYDFRRLFNMQRILMNPRAIVAYDWRFYKYFKWFLRHPVLKWWIEKVYDGAWMQKDVLVVGDERDVSRWDGGDCHPWTE